MKSQGNLILLFMVAAVILAVTLMAGIAPLQPARSAGPGGPSIAVPGEATVHVLPDAALIGLRVMAEAGSFEAAQSALKAKQHVVVARLKETFSVHDVTVAQLGIEVVHPDRHTGRLSLSALVDSTDTAVRVADAMKAIDGVLVTHIEPTVKDMAERRAEAITRAIDDARAKAGQVSTATGLKARTIKSVAVQSITQPEQRLGAERPGQPLWHTPLQIRVSVLVTFEAP